MKVHLFNPENDLALAAGKANYTPPLPVRRFKEALAQLPRWYADTDDIILTPGMTVTDLPANAFPAPWGWSANTIAQFQKVGLSGPFPDVEIIRRLSHRRTALNLHRELQRSDLPYPLPPEPNEITDADQITSADIILKSPWSCSGRGVVDCSNITRESIINIAKGIIRRQGSVMVEPKLDKTKDFALLYEIENGEVAFKGISSFFTSATDTAYGGNLCASQDELRAELPEEQLSATIEAVAEALSRIVAPYYSGPVGVDMILYGPEQTICPTIEVNLRRTMGFVALSLYERLGRGIFRISPRPEDGIQLIDTNPYFSATFSPLP